jgi:protein phosphatase 1 regulatory subunit 7
LRRLDVQSNRLTQVENLGAQLESLEELYLAHNGIDDEGASLPTGLALKFTNLNVIDMSRNRLTSTAPFGHLEAVEELWLSGNEIAIWDGVEPLKEAAAAGKQSLATLYLEYNPVASEFEYRKRLAEWMPSLTQIDANLVGGLAAHGLQSVAADSTQAPFSLEDQMRQLQSTAIERAQEETKAMKEKEQS